MFITSFLVVTFCFLSLVWIRRRRHQQRIFERLGVPGPKPEFFAGNFNAILKKGFTGATLGWTKQYGKLFGYYEGAEPVLVVSDPEHVKQIATKEFDKFHSHQPTPVERRKEERKVIFFAEGDKWRRLRNIMSPLFTGSKIKEMSPLINKSMDDLLVLFNKRCEEAVPFNIHRDFMRLTMDVIGSCAFGIDAGCIRDDQSRFLTEAQRTFNKWEDPPLLLFLLLGAFTFFPGLINGLRKIRFFDEYMSIAPAWLRDTGLKVIKERQLSKKNTNAQRVDLVKLLIESKSSKELDAMPLSDEEMAAQMEVFMTAGYETSSAALAFTAYRLAVHPEVQTKLQAEIDESFPPNEVIQDYTVIQKLPYLEGVMKEVLRIHPIAPLNVTRQCYEDTKLGDIRIPKGMYIHFNMDDLHFNPDLWGKYDPQDFVPERFLEDCKDAHNSMAWIPFGVGPRTCIGMKFAQMEYKIALVRILRKYSIRKCDKTKVPCPTKKMGMNSPSEGVYVVLDKKV